MLLEVQLIIVMMNFEKAARIINRSLNKKQPEKFNSQWIKIAAEFHMSL